MSDSQKPAVPADNCPYPGLRPYLESEKDKFFGREADCKILVDKILVHRLTLLFAATGVGKSSLLQAAVLPQLKSPSGENLDVAYYIDWVSNPLAGLKQAVRQALQDSGSWRPEIVYTPKADEKLLDFFSFCTLFVRQPLIVVLDQFEEFFRYQRGRENFEPFLEQLTAVMTAERLPLHLVFSMREDFALELNAFKKYLPLSVFGNLYRLEKLGRKAAQEAILSPLQGTGFSYEPELQEQLLKDLLNREMRRDADSPLADMTEMVEPPYLQITCRQLWEREQTNPDKTLRLMTYQQAGGAKGLLETYILTTLEALSEREKVLASHAFDHLIGQRGTKVAHTVPKLAELVGVSETELDKMLDKLSKARILRGQKREDTLWYELYHDMFSTGLEKWNAGQKEKMRNRRLMKIGAAVAAGVLIITFGAIWGVNHFNHHLRLASLDGSLVEVYQGQKGWPDPFGQQQYAYETLLSDRDMEVDKRFREQGILDYVDLNNELTGYRPFAERIHGYIENGNFNEVLKLRDKAFRDTSNNPKILRDIIRSLFGLKTETGFNLIKQTALANKQSSLSETDLSLLQENTLLFPLDQLTPFPFFYDHFKQQSYYRGYSIINDPRLVDKIIDYLHDTNTTAREHAAYALGSLGDPRTIPQLTNALKDENESVRSYIFGALGLIGDPSTIPQLINALKDENKSVRWIAAEALGQIGNPSTIPQLANALKDENQGIRQKAIEALGQIGDPSTVPQLANALKDENQGIRQKAIEALGQIGDPSTVPQLANTLKDENNEGVRSSAAKALGLIGDPSAIPQLANALKDENNEGVRYSAAEALGRIGDPSTIPQLTNALKDEDQNVRRNVAKALGLIGNPSAIPQLANAFKDENSEYVRYSAAEALGLIGDPSAIPQLTNALKDENNGYMRSSAAEALGLIGDPSATPQLANALKDENNEDVRSSAAEALGRIGDPSALPQLANAIKDENKDVRSSAAQALGRIGDPSTISELANALKDENEDVRLNAAGTLGRIGDPSAITVLANAIKDENEDVRSSAVSALELIGVPHQIQFDAPSQKESVSKWADFFGDYGEKLSEISGSVNDRRALLQALNLPASAERNQQLLTLVQKADAHLSIRQKAIETLAEAKDAKLVEPLQPLKSHAQLNKTITELEEKVLPPQEIMHDSSRKLFARLAAFKRLVKENPATAKQEILRIIQQPQEDAFSNLAYRLLGDLQITDNGVIPLLQQRLDALDGQLRDWRKLRDSKPLSGLTTDEQDKVLEELRQAKQGIKNQSFAFDYAYTLSRLDPDIGVELLTHNLADVRQGAYTGFAMKANIEWLKKLDQAREARRDDPVFYHTAYRAIDMGLSRLEILGNNPNEGEKDKELKELQAWQQELESAAPRTTPDDPDDEVLQRLQWTTLMMDHYNKLDKEFREKYGKKRVWPEDTLPVNQPYPAKP